MWFLSLDFMSFWFAAWSLPLRAACPWVSAQARQVANPDMPTPKWLHRFLIQRWVGEAIARRVAWQQAQPDAPRYRFGRRSEPSWSETATLPYAWHCLHVLEEGILRWLMDIELERLLRVIQTPPSDVGEELWTLTAMAACQHLEQLYGELKRRYKAPRARELVRDALRRLVIWRADEAEKWAGGV